MKLTSYFTETFYSLWYNMRPSKEARLILDMDAHPELPRYYRKHPTLPISGSGQFSQTGFEVLLNQVPENKKLHIIDLRQECHGFVNALAISWYAKNNAANIGKSCDEVEAIEKNTLSSLVDEPTVSLYQKKPPQKDVPFSVQIGSVETEKEFIEHQNLRYTRIPVTDHEAPTVDAVDQFVITVKTLKSDEWVHLHCRKGRGRTTTFMTLFDIMQNAQKETFQEIVNRNIDHGGSDIMYVPRKPHPKHLQKLKRREFLKEFYKYSKVCGPEFTISWHSWLETTQNPTSFNLQF